MSNAVEEAVRALRDVVSSVAPESLSGEEARRVVDALAEAEKVVVSSMARLTPRVLETGAYAQAGHSSGADWLAAVSGSSSSAARARLAAAERAAAEPELAEPLRQGQLSAPELKVLSESACNAPQALGDLVDLALGEASYRELSDAATRAAAAARSAEADRVRRARVHRTRHLSWHQDASGGVRGEFLCDEAAWARVFPHLEAAATERWRAAGSVEGEPLAAHRLDALIDLLSRRSADRVNGHSRPHALLLIDAAALGRGHLERGETCEIEGVGPVSLETAIELLGESTTQFVVTTGRDVTTVTSTRRALPQRVAMALVVRDRTCVVPGCGKRLGLQADHCDVDYSKGGPTELANLVRLCAPHHGMKTNGGWRIVGGPGRWKWVAPEHPPSAGRLARNRRLAVARARAFKPRRT